MAVYDFQRFKLLLVEDNNYVRRILDDMLRSFKFGNVMARANGQEAIEFIKGMSDNPETASAAGLDLVITDLLEEAEAHLERAALDFTDWANNYLSQLAKLCAEALTKKGSRDTYFEQINLLAHELRGQGGTFGYPLITIFGKMLYECTGKGCRGDDTAVDIVKAHIDAMRAVLREKIAGDGGEVGRALMEMLKEAVKKNMVVE